MNHELTIIIPAKNEEKYIGLLLDSLIRQDYEAILDTQIIVADANSTDKTREIILNYCDRLKIKLVDGGLPSVGRNNGARYADTNYVLFMDADLEIYDQTFLRRAMQKIKEKNLLCLAAYLSCPSGNWADKLLYYLNNFAQFCAQFFSPFGSGMFILIDRQKFMELGGFDEKVTFSEDYFLTKQIPIKRFGIVAGRIIATNRRFKKIGHWKMFTMFFWQMIHTWDKKYFYQDKKYFD